MLTQDGLQHLIDSLSNLCASSEVELTVSKCQMICVSQNVEHIYDYNIDSTTLIAKNLGVIMNSTLRPHNYLA